MIESDVQRAQKYTRRKNRKANLAKGYVPLSQALQNESRPAGWKSLAMAVLEQAVMDYFLLVRNGYIKELKYTGKNIQLLHGGSKRAHIQGIYAGGVHDLIYFWEGHQFWKYLEAALPGGVCKNLDPYAVVAGLIANEKAGNIYSKGNRK